MLQHVSSLSAGIPIGLLALSHLLLSFSVQIICTVCAALRIGGRSIYHQHLNTLQLQLC